MPAVVTITRCKSHRGAKRKKKKKKEAVLHYLPRTLTTRAKNIRTACSSYYCRNSPDVSDEEWHIRVIICIWHSSSDEFPRQVSSKWVIRVLTSSDASNTDKIWTRYYQKPTISVVCSAIHGEKLESEVRPVGCTYFSLRVTRHGKRVVSTVLKKKKKLGAQGLLWVVWAGYGLPREDWGNFFP